MPLTRWAKLLMLTQPTVSILTLILAAARAVNILRSTGPCAAPQNARLAARRRVPPREPGRCGVDRRARRRIDVGHPGGL